MTTDFAAPLRAFDTIDTSGDTVVVTKTIVATDPYLEGHYPHLTIYPGVFSIETVYQAARAALRERTGGDATLVGIKSVSFSAPLLPGDTLVASLTITESGPDLFDVKAKCTRGDGRGSAQVKLTVRVNR